MIRLLVSLTMLALVGAGTVRAQAPETGTWTGKITPPDSPTFSITVEVTATGDSVQAELHWGDFGTFVLREMAIAGGRFTFTLMLDEDEAIWCDLAWKDDGSYAGECVDEDGEPGNLSLTPPSAGGGAH